MPCNDTMKSYLRALDILAIVVLLANPLPSAASTRPERAASTGSWRPDKFNGNLQGYVYDLLNSDRGISHFLHFGLKVKVV